MSDYFSKIIGEKTPININAAFGANLLVNIIEVNNFGMVFHAIESDSIEFPQGKVSFISHSQGFTFTEA
jgi:hypothetical protein